MSRAGDFLDESYGRDIDELYGITWDSVKRLLESGAPLMEVFDIVMAYIPEDQKKWIIFRTIQAIPPDTIQPLCSKLYSMGE